jgi:hypothetical protein
VYENLIRNYLEIISLLRNDLGSIIQCYGTNDILKLLKVAQWFVSIWHL